MSSLKLALRPELKKGDTVIVAVSGGVDSMVMLQCLHALNMYTLVVCHMNHLLREESTSDASFVKSVCERMGLTCEVAEDDVSVYAKLKGKTIEESARDIRYGFLQDMREKHCAKYILTAHTKDDNAETILLHMTRGAGTAGLEGIRRLDKKRRLLRPFLETSKKDILAFSETNNIRYVEDVSNMDLVYSRNRVRHEVLPSLSKINSDVQGALCRFGGLLTDVNDYMRSQALQWLEGAGDPFDLAAFRALHPALRREVVKVSYEEIHGSSVGFTAAMCEEVIRLFVRGITSKKVYFGSNFEAACEYSQGVFRKTAEVVAKETEVLQNKQLRERSQSFNFSVDLLERASVPPAENPFTVLLDYDKLKEKRLYVRYRRNGDVFCPSGMNGQSKKLQDYFVDSKVAADLRDRVPLLVTDKDEIVWIVGMRIDDRFKVNDETQHVLRVDYKNEGGENKVN